MGHGLLEEVGRLESELVRGQQLILGLADGGLDRFRREPDVVDLGSFQGILDDLDAVALIVDGELGIEPQPLGVLPQEASAEAVKRAYPDAMAGDQRLDALAHFAGGLVGERDGQDVPGLDALLEQPAHAPGDDAGLAAAGAGDDQQGAFEMGDSVVLCGGKVGEKLRHRCLHTGLQK